MESSIIHKRSTSGKLSIETLMEEMNPVGLEKYGFCYAEKSPPMERKSFNFFASARSVDYQRRFHSTNIFDLNSLRFTGWKNQSS